MLSQEFRPARHPSQHPHRYNTNQYHTKYFLGSNAPHVRRGLDGWDEFQSSVSDTDNADKRTGDDAEPLFANNDGADKDVDCTD
jgi:hypothetical protein